MSLLSDNIFANFQRSFAWLLFVAIAVASAAPPAAAVSKNSQSSQPVLRYDISGSNAWYPYFIPDSTSPGIVTELVVAVLAEAQIDGQQVALPPKRTLVALANGELDFDVSSPSWFPNNEVPEGFVLSDGLIEIKEYVVTLPENAHRFRHSAALKSQNIGTVRGYFYSNDNIFTRVDFISESKLIEALIKERIDAVIMGDLPALYWAQKKNARIAFGAVNSTGDLHFRLRDEHAHLIPQINHAIKKLKQQGKVTDIISRYLSNLPDAAMVASNNLTVNAD